MEFLSVLFGWIWIGAAIACVYFLYGVLSNEAPVDYLLFNYLLWSIGVGFIARNIAATFSRSKEQADYVEHLVERGYKRAEASSAWESTINGGSNLLLKLQQADTLADSARRTVEMDN